MRLQIDAKQDMAIISSSFLFFRFCNEKSQL
jgi:hypothetical protein